MKRVYNDYTQNEAINLNRGPAMILAGPGSGKTHIITHRITHLIDNEGIKPERILVITFTKLAANQMKERFEKLYPAAAYKVTFATFHSIFYQFLRILNPKSTPQIIGTKERYEILKRLIDSSYRSDTTQAEDVDTFSNEISRYKSNNLKIDSRMFMDEKETDEFLFLCAQYDQMLKAANKMDYDDILIRCLQMLEESSNNQERIRLLFDAILVDEFQDINAIQYKVLKLIAPPDNNLFVVGDDDQSIYGFRGSRPEIMNRFKEDYPACKTIELEGNYRSLQEIINKSNEIIKQNPIRLKEKLQKQMSEIERADDKDAVELFSFNNSENEVSQIEKIISFCKEKGLNLAILTRSNKDLEFYRRLLSDEGNENRNYKIYMEILKDIREYILAAMNSKRENYLNIINKPLRYIPSEIFTDEMVNLELLSKKYLGTYKSEELQLLSRHMKLLKKSTPLSFAKYLMDIMGYRKYVLDKVPPSLKKDMNLYMDRIISESCNYKNFDEFLKALDNLIHKSELPTVKAKESDILFLTYHGSKGLEFDVVILPDVNEGKVPCSMSMKSDNLYEERRLFYVAMTRARKKVYIMVVKKEESRQLLPSRFIYSLIRETD